MRSLQSNNVNTKCRSHTHHISGRVIPSPTSIKSFSKPTPSCSARASSSTTTPSFQTAKSLPRWHSKTKIQTSSPSSHGKSFSPKYNKKEPDGTHGITEEATPNWGKGLHFLHYGVVASL